MPKESPNTSSLWTGPQNPRNRAGQAAAVPTRPWWGALVSSSPRGPPCPSIPIPKAGRVTQAGLSPPRDQGTGAARAAVSEWGRWHDTPPPGAVVLGWHQRSPRGWHRGRDTPAWCLGPGNKVASVPDLKPTGIQGGTPKRRGDPSRPQRRRARRGCGELRQ